MAYEFDRRLALAVPLTWFLYLSQEATWVPKGRPPLPITEMDAAWRHNAANWLLKQAKALTLHYELGEIAFIFGSTAPTVVADANGQPVPGPEVPCFAPRGEWAQDTLERELAAATELRTADPEAWLKSTPLYRALVDGLPDNVAELARHWSSCALRTGQGSCDCWTVHRTECPVNMTRDITAPCHCHDNSPEWTL